MPNKAPTPCTYPGCSQLAYQGARCGQHPSAKRERDRHHDRQRCSAQERGYNARWQKTRKLYLNRNPLCAMCKDQGELVEATVVDHIIPHRGNMILFWDEDNWQPLCTKHHNRDKQRQERHAS